MTEMITHLDGATATGAEVAAAIRTDGAVVVDSVVTPEVIDAVMAELSPYMDETPLGGEHFAGESTKRTGALIARSANARDLVAHPLSLATADDLLGHVTSYQLHVTQAIAIGPGESAQPIHRDQWAFDFFPFPHLYEVQCNSIWAATDFTEENGATRVVLGSNHLADKLKFGQADTVAAEMSKGSVLFYNGAVYHGGGANDSAETRVGLNITYTLSFLRQEENQYLSCPLEIAETLDDDLLRLMGYRNGAYALGYIGDLRDPLEAIRGRPANAADDRAGFGA